MDKKTKKDWTIMVYMAGGNNLSEDMVTGLMGMKKCLEQIFNVNVAFLAYYDTERYRFLLLNAILQKNPAKKAQRIFLFGTAVSR